MFGLPCAFIASQNFNFWHGKSMEVTRALSMRELKYILIKLTSLFSPACSIVLIVGVPKRRGVSSNFQGHTGTPSCAFGEKGRPQAALTSSLSKQHFPKTLECAHRQQIMSLPRLIGLNCGRSPFILDKQDSCLRMYYRNVAPE